MILTNEQKEQLITEFSFAASRSSGPGGQNVNKVNTKVELRFILAQSKVLTDEQIQILTAKLESQLTTEGEILVVSQATRSQLKNKEDAIAKFIHLLQKALKPRRKRVPTKPSGTSVLKRLDTKKQLSQKKNLRKKPE
ncbi:MAG: alternative ribosome rescue aminoacyl-tRNA hydrolase ArfB [Salinivirgaceae bacterium]|jgi:ribosome-associated protein